MNTMQLDVQAVSVIPETSHIVNIPMPVLAFQPDNAKSPGESLTTVMQYRGISKAALARETGRPVAVINAILDGVAQITTQFAMQLEVLTDVPAQFWLEADKRFRRLQARTRVAPERKPTFTAHTNHAPRCIRITLEEL